MSLKAVCRCCGGLAASERLGDRERLSSALQFLAMAEQDCGDHTASVETLRRAYPLANVAEGRIGILQGLAARLAAQGMFPAALKSLDDAIALAKNMDSRAAESHLLSHRGSVQHRAGLVEEARRSLEEALQLAPDQRGEAQVLMSLAALHLEENDYERAKWLGWPDLVWAWIVQRVTAFVGVSLPGWLCILLGGFYLVAFLYLWTGVLNLARIGAMADTQFIQERVISPGLYGWLARFLSGSFILVLLLSVGGAVFKAAAGIGSLLGWKLPHLELDFLPEAIVRSGGGGLLPRPRRSPAGPAWPR